MLEGYRLVVFWCDAGAIVLDLDRIEAIVLKPNFCRDCQLSSTTRVRGIATDGSGACIDAILDQLFADGLEVDDDLAGLDLVDGATLDGFDGGHIKPCQAILWSVESPGDDVKP